MTKLQQAERRLWLSLLEQPWDDARHEIRTEMGRLGLSIDDLTYKLRRRGHGVARVTVSRWLRGETAPQVDAIREIVGALAAVEVGDSPKGRQFSPPHLGEDFRPTSRADRGTVHAPHSEASNLRRQGVRSGNPPSGLPREAA